MYHSLILHDVFQILELCYQNPQEFQADFAALVEQTAWKDVQVAAANDALELES